MAGSLDQELATVKILVNGSPIPDEYEIYSVHVSKSINRIASARIEIIDGSAAEEDFPISESKEFLPGNEIEIQAGWDLKTKSIFKGVVVSQTIRAQADSGPVLIVGCKDKALKMTIGRKSGAFTDQTDSAVMTAIARRNGISASVKSTSPTFGQLVQYYATDWDFLVSRAEANGMIVLAADNKLEVAPPKVSGSPQLTLTFGQDIFEIETALSAGYQLGSVQAHAWDSKTQKLNKASASKPSVPKQGNLTGDKLSSIFSPSSFNLVTTADLQSGSLGSWANAQLMKSRLALIRGVVKAYGDSELAPNQVIELKGMGDRFNGKAYVSAIEHEIKEGNWWSRISTGLNHYWFADRVEPTYQSASSLLPGIRGLQNATVKAIIEDPDSETRVQVTVPTMTADSEEGTLWARWVQPYASDGVGHYFMPEIGDEVVLGFLNEDPRSPVIIGSLYSSKKAPPRQPDAKNSKKAIVTKSKLTIEFDDENKVLILETPGKNKIVLSDQDQGIAIQDQNDNKITLAPGGITMKSPAAIKIEAGGQVSIKGMGVKINSDTDASLKAATSLSVSGLEVSLSGDATFSAKGGAQASVSADGQLALKGGIIMIN